MTTLSSMMTSEEKSRPTRRPLGTSMSVPLTIMRRTVTFTKRTSDLFINKFNGTSSHSPYLGSRGMPWGACRLKLHESRLEDLLHHHWKANRDG